MAFRRLNNGVMMPSFGLGTWQLNQETQCIDTVNTALSLGIRLIDSASVYKNESYIGKALKQFQGFNDNVLETANGKGVFVTSKAGTTEMGFEKTYEACLRSLDNLKQDALDLYLLHWPGASGLPHDSNLHRQIRLEAWQALEKLYAEGKVRAIGVSNFLSHHLHELMDDGAKIVPQVDQLELHPLCPNVELRKTAKELGIVVQAYSSLGTGKSLVLENSVVNQIASSEHKTPSQVLLRWAVQQDILIIPKTTQKPHMIENLKVMESSMALSDESMRILNNLATEQNSARVCWDPTQII